MDILVVLALAVLALVVIARAVVVVPQGKVFLVERLGRFEKALSPGVAFVMPFVDRVSARVQMGERVGDLPATEAVSLDNRSVTLAGQVRYRVVDARRAVYEVADYEQAVIAVAVRALRTAVGRVEAWHAPGAVAETRALEHGETAAWGLEVLRIDATGSLDGAAVAGLEQRVQRERDARVLEHAMARGERPSPDGRPTLAQVKAYERFVAEVRQSPEYLEALRLAEDGRPADAARRTARASGAIAAGATGLVEQDGRMWTARNISGQAIAPGGRCIVEGEDGSVLLVRPDAR